MTPPPSPRLACWRLEDAPALRRALDLSDAHLRPWVPFMRGEPRTLAETTAVIRRAIAQFVADATGSSSPVRNRRDHRRAT